MQPRECGPSYIDGKSKGVDEEERREGKSGREVLSGGSRLRSGR